MMRGSLFSPMWYRVAHLHPSLRAHVRVNRQIYRGETWHTLQDMSSGRHHRLNEVAYQFVGRLDGRFSIQQIWDSLVASSGDEAPTQGEIIGVLTHLHQANLIQCETSPDLDELFQRGAELRSKRRFASINPLAFRIALLDPTRFLDRLQPYVQPLFRPVVFFLWCMLVVSALFAAGQNWEMLRAHAAVHVLTPRYLFLLWICYPVIKTLHELAHALSIRNWGGEVHEMGITLMVLVPVPYVDASSSTSFRDKRQRMLVAAAGVMVELFIASLALFLWFAAENGLVRDMAFVTLLIGGASTVLFNGNPLLKYDGYYILSDALEFPNLAGRSNAYLLYLAKRYLLGVASAASTATSRDVRIWLASYGFASWCYRLFVMVLIAGWVGTASALLALLMAIWVIGAFLLKPAVSAIRYLHTSPQLNNHRLRAWVAAMGGTVVVLVFLGVIPLPFSTQVEGVVWLPEQARVRTATDGFVQQVLAADGQAVKRGQPLFVLSNPDLVAKRDEIESKLSGLGVRLYDAMYKDPVAARAVAEEIESVRAELRQTTERLDGLLIRSQSNGVLAIVRPQDLEARFVTKGTVLAHVLAPEEIIVRAVVSQEDADLVRQHVETVEVRLADNPMRVLPAKPMGEIPAATNTLPSAALGDKGGGGLVTDPADKEGLRTLQPIFVIDLRIPASEVKRIGGRAWVRFDHGAKPLLSQWSFRFRQLFLRYLGNES